MAVAAKIGKHLFKYRKNGPVNDALTGRTIGSDFDIGCTLRCFKSVFFGEALQRSEIYLWKVSRWPSRVAGHPILEIVRQPSKATSRQALRVAPQISLTKPRAIDAGAGAAVLIVVVEAAACNEDDHLSIAVLRAVNTLPVSYRAYEEFN
jgi:hypothetical protein